MPIELSYTDSFKRSLKRLSRKYRNIRQDLEPLLNQISSGNTPGDKIKGVGYSVYKVRIRNSDSNQGTRGGYRVIYYLEHKEKRILVALYSKAEQSDISAELIQNIIKETED